MRTKQRNFRLDEGVMAQIEALRTAIRTPTGARLTAADVVRIGVRLAAEKYLPSAGLSGADGAGKKSRKKSATGVDTV